MSVFKSIIVSTVLGLGALSAAQAATAVSIDSYDNGWVNNRGQGSKGNTNTATGLYRGNTYASYYLFDLTDLMGKDLEKATLVFRACNGRYQSTNSSETLNLFDVTTDAKVFETKPGQKSLFNDITSGERYGSTTVGGKYRSSMPELTVSLNSVALRDLNSVLKGSTSEFAIGASLDAVAQNSKKTTRLLWSGSRGLGAAELIVTERVGPAPSPSPAPVPVPAALPMLLAGLGGLGYLKRRKG